MAMRQCVWVLLNLLLLTQLVSISTPAFAWQPDTEKPAPVEENDNEVINKFRKKTGKISTQQRIIEGVSSIDIPLPGEMKRLLGLAADAYEAEQYPQVIKVFQLILDEPQEFLLPSEKYQSLRSFVESLILSDHDHLWKVYTQDMNPVADGIWRDYENNQQPELLGSLSQRFFLTDAGSRAQRQLISRAMDRGEYATAEILLTHLLTHPLVNHRESISIRIQQLKCYRELNQKTEADAILNELADSGKDEKVFWQGETIPLWKDFDKREFQTALANWLKYQSQFDFIVPTAQWSNPRGDIRGSGMVESICPVWEPKRPLKLLTMNECDDNDGLKIVQQLIDEHAKQHGQDATRLVSWQPLIIDNLLVVKGLGTIKAFNLKTQELAWESAYREGAFEFLLQSLNGTQGDLNSSIRQGRLSQYIQDRLFQDRLSGQLSSDGQRVYALHDIGMLNIGSRRGGEVTSHPLLSTDYNSLMAFDLRTGKIQWKTGSANFNAETPYNGFFLGVPVPLRDRVFVLTEQQSEIHLTSFDARTGNMILTQPLCSVPIPTNPDERSLFEQRRFLGLRPIYSNGLLICPTGIGAVYAVEPLTGQIVWKRELINHHLPTGQDEMNAQQARVQALFRQQDRQALMHRSSFWQSIDGLQAGSRVIFPVNEISRIVALNSATGHMDWEIHEPDQICIIGSQKNILVTLGKYSVNAWSPEDGKPLWTFPLSANTPAGTGILTPGLVHVVMNSQEVLSLEIATGTLRAVNKLTQHQLGANLSASHDVLVATGADKATIFATSSQTLHEIHTRLEQSAKPDHKARFWKCLYDIYEQKVTPHHGVDQLLQISLDLAATHTPQDSDFEALVNELLTLHTLEGLRVDFANFEPLTDKLKPLIQGEQNRFWLAERLYRGYDATNHAGRALNSLYTYLSEMDTVPGLYRINPHSRIKADRWVQNELYARIKQKHPAATTPKLQQETAEYQAILKQIELLVDQEQSAGSMAYLYSAVAPLIQGSELEFRILRKILEKNNLSHLVRERYLLNLSESPIAESAVWSRMELIQDKRSMKMLDKEIIELDELSKSYANVTLESGQKVSDWLAKNGSATNLIPVQVKPATTTYTATLEPLPVAASTNRTAIHTHVYRGHASKDWRSYFNSANERLLSVFDDQGTKVFETKLPSNVTSIGMNTCEIHIDGSLLVFSNAINLFGYDMTDFITNPYPQPQWVASHIDPPGDQVEVITTNVNFQNQNIRIIRNRDGENDEPLFGSNRIGFSQQQIITWQDNKLVALDPMTSQPIWIQEKFPAGSGFILRKDSIMLLDGQQQVMHVHSAINGMKQAEIAYPPDGWTHLTWLDGIGIISKDNASGKWLAGIDASHLEKPMIWERKLPSESQIYFDNGLKFDQLLVCRAQGGVDMIDQLTGRNIATFDIEYDPQLWDSAYPQKINVISDDKNWYLITGFRMDSTIVPRQFIGTWKCDAHGPVYCIRKSDNKLQWTSIVKNLFYLGDLPDAFPALAFGAVNSGRISGSSHQKTAQLLLIDKSSGEPMLNESTDHKNSPGVVILDYHVDPAVGSYSIVTSHFVVNIDRNTMTPDGKAATGKLDSPSRKSPLPAPTPEPVISKPPTED
jgi:outer membrane protein assembly factor BamB